MLQRTEKVINFAQSSNEKEFLHLKHTNMRRLLTIMAVMVFTVLAQAADYKYLIIETADGTTYDLAATGQTITFSNGNLVSSNGITLPLASLSKMYFSETSGISEMTKSTTTDGLVTIYSSTGTLIGQFDNVFAARQALLKGVYVMKFENGTTTKMAVK